MNTQAIHHSAVLTRTSLKSNSWVQLAIGALFVLWAGSYWPDHLGETHLMVSGMAVHLYGLGLLITSILQLAGISRAREAGERIMLLSGFVVWVPVVLIALHAIGIDVWNASPTFVVANQAASIGLGAFFAWKLNK